MAIPNDYIDKITNKDSGESRIISPAADKVRVDNENFEGTDLDEVLDEVAESISEHHGLVNGRVPFGEATPIVLASIGGDNTDITPYSEGDYFAVLSSEKIYQVVNGTADEVGEIDDKLIYCDKSDSTLYRWNGSQFVQVGGNSGGGDGTVTGVKVGSTTYEPTDGVVDLSTPFGGKVDKNGTDSLMTAAEHTKLQNLPTNEQLTQQLDNKANDNAVVKSITVNGGTAQTPTQGNVNIVVPSGGLTESDISVETQGDGTVDINVATDTYTINLNHTHENMAKIVKCTEATLPQTLENDTIYVQVDNATTPTDIECLYLFGLEFTGGGVPAGSPVITLPKASVINLGTAYGQGGATGTVTIRAKNLSEPLTVRVGTGFSLAYGQSTGQTITIPVADATAGADVDVFADAYATAGTLLIYGETDNVSLSVSLTSNVIEELEGVQLNGTQWLETDVHPTANTKLEMDCLFEKNTITENTSATHNGKFIDARHDDNGTTREFTAQTGSASEQVAKAYSIQVWLNRPYSYSSYNHLYEQQFNNEATFCRRSILTFDGQLGYASFQGMSWGTDKPEGNNLSNIKIGYNEYSSVTFNCFDLTIYSLKLYSGATLIREYLPVKRNGVTGLLDSVSGAFISSSTSTELVPIAAVSQS